MAKEIKDSIGNQLPPELAVEVMEGMLMGSWRSAVDGGREERERHQRLSQAIAPSLERKRLEVALDASK